MGRADIMVFDIYDETIEDTYSSIVDTRRKKSRLGRGEGGVSW